MTCTLYTIGPYDTINFVAQAAKRSSTAITSTTEDSDFPLVLVYDGEPDSVFKFTGADTASIPILTADLVFNLNPSFTTWTVASHPDGWDDVSSGTGSIEEENTIVNSAPASLQLNSSGGSNNGRARQIVEVIAGNPYTIAVALRGDGTNSVSAYIRNLQTGKWLNSSSVWTSSKTATASRSTGSFSTTTRTFTIEDVATSGSGVVQLELRAEGVNGTLYVDDFVIWPHWNFAGVFGHNIPDPTTVTTQSDDNSGFSSPTTRHTHTAPRRRPSFYGSFSTVTERFVRLHMSTVSSGVDKVYIGEWFIGYTKTLDPGIRSPFSIERSVDLVGGGYGKPFGIQEEESVSIDTTVPGLSITEWDVFRLEIGRAGKWGGRSAVLVPDSATEEVHLGLWGIDEARINSHFDPSGTFSELKYPIKVR